MSCEDIIIQSDDSSLLVQATEPAELILQADCHSLILGIACPIGTGEPNAAANVGGEAEVFRDKVAGVLNFRTIEGLGTVGVAVNGDVVEISSTAISGPVITTVDPAPTDAAYAVGQVWINTVTDTVWVITDNTPAAAVWQQAAGPAWVEDSFTATLGQITFILSNAPTDPSSLEFDVNGVTYEIGVDYSRSGVTITWLNAKFSMDAGDLILARYR